MESETPAQRRWRLYSCGYREGQRLCLYPATLKKAERDASESDLYMVSLGVLDWVEGFRDGFYGRVPDVETPLYIDFM